MGHRIAGSERTIQKSASRQQALPVIDSRLSFGHVAEPGVYATTITRPDLFRHYLEQQISLLIENHGVSVEIGFS